MKQANSNSNTRKPRKRPESPVKLPGKLVRRPTEKLRPYERNPRTHTAEQITKIAASLLEFGWTNPILVDAKGGIIAGHGRLLAAQELGMKTVPVIELPHLTEAQKRAYVIADNRLALDAGWDEDLLAEELKALEDLDFNLELTGFDLDELHGLLEDETAEEVAAPEPPEDPVTQPGDLWILGDHRLLCGDSSDPAAVDRLLGGAQVHLVNTDPPYNVKVEPRSNNAINAGLSSFSGPKHHQSLDLARHPEKAKATGKMRAKDRPLINDYVSAEAFDELLLSWFGNIARVLLPGRAFYIWGGYANVANYPPVLKATGLYFSQAIIWVKEHPVLTRKDFMGNHEWCFYGWREGAGHRFFGPNNAVDVWAVKKVNPQSMVHLTQKPIELAVRAIQYSSKPGENVLDLFGGSGSTLMGAEQTGRRCLMMELDPAYCDVIVERWQTETGEEAVLEGDGETFEAVAANRGVARVE
ncbi:MAG: site-specific DNA-methyltransferase [Candidatus Eisenbacteria sp.]|nr:site-specific DNA-methyltransferase [Candidatus Eisenbacteria bacterium]